MEREAPAPAVVEPDRPAGSAVPVIAVTSLAAVLLYVDRVCISILGVYVSEDLGLTLGQWAWVLGVFFYGYAAGQVPAGWLGDRFGPRRMLTLWILAWSALTAATGLAEGFVLLLVARLACGLAQAGAYPTAATLLRRWVPVSRRGKANSVVTLGGRIGAVVAPVLTALLIVALMPPGVSYRMSSRDVIDARRLGRDLVESRDDATAPFRRAVRDRLSPAELSSAQRLAVAAKPSAEDIEVVLAALDRQLADRSVSGRLGGLKSSLPREAAAILELSEDRRTPEQTERLNRLALEVGFPGAIRQVYGASWRRVLLLYGAVGVVVALLYWGIVRDDPRPSRGEAQALPQDVSADGRPEEVGAEGNLLKAILASRNLWLSGFAQLGINIGWVFLITLLPTYLSEVFRVPLEERGRMMGVPVFIGCFGMLAGGVLTDRLTRSIGPRWGRSLPIALTLFVCALALLACPWLPSAWAVVAALSLMAALVDLGVPSIWAFMQDVGGPDSGAALGWGNMWGNLGAALSPVLLSGIKEQGGWNAAFAACAVAFFLAGLAGLGLNATRPLRAK